jgi:hypothetical protein
MVTNPWKISYPSTTDENNAVLLKVVAFTTDVGNDFLPCG